MVDMHEKIKRPVHRSLALSLDEILCFCKAVERKKSITDKCFLTM
jgi:hypothetical protein